MACFPDGNGGQICRTDPEFFCPDGQQAVCTPGKPETSEFCRCEVPAKPFICEARILWQRDASNFVSVVNDPSCPDVGMAIALSVYLARMMISGAAR